jgi:hypothetical protein
MTAFGIPTIGAVGAWRIDLGVAAPASGLAGAAASAASAVDPDIISFSSVDYRGRVDATLSSGLDPGRYAITVEGITEDQFVATKKLALKTAQLCANLYLWWDDASPPGALPVVAVLRVTALRRRPGVWRYELLVEAREWVYDLLGGPAPQVTGTSALDRAQAIADACKIVYSPPRDPAASPDADPLAQRDPNSQESARDALSRLENDMVGEAATANKKRGGLGMYLIRDGKLRLGPSRLDDDALLVNIKQVDAATGLISIERRGAVDATDNLLDGDSPPQGGRRDLYTATLRGRPDLKPGHVVTLTSPELDATDGDFDVSLGLKPNSATTVTAYIQEVQHRLSREQGFTTVIYCVAATSEARTSLVDRLWFATAKSDTSTTAGGDEGRIARSLRKRPERIGTDIAQVRQLFGSGDLLPVQTEKLLRGAPNDGKPHGATRLGFDRGADPIQGVPYASPFAWGAFGLSVPRYPGMRVVLVHRGGDADDAIDIGALWDNTKAPKASPGDWWLSLPAAIPADQRASIADGAKPSDPAGKASNDLIDADGNRVIAVGKLTVRVGANALTDAGTRPTPSDPEISIEHSSGATITIDQNGAISIQAKGKLTLGCDQDIVLDAKQITMQVSSSVAINKK